MFNNIKNFAFCAALTLLSLGVVSCSEDVDDVLPTVTEGVVFQFDMRTVYTVSEMTDIATVDMTLIKDGVEMVISNLKMEGDKDSVLSLPTSLLEGTYTMKGYVAYGAAATVIMECEFDLDDIKSTFEIVAGSVVTIEIPVSVRVVNFENYIINALIGLCREVFGDDESLWPWDKTENVRDWQCLQFELYEGTDEISHLGAIDFDSNQFEGWKMMTKVPNGTISKLITISSYTFNNLPNLTELPDDLHEMPNLTSLIITNTALESFPENLEKSRSLGTLLIDGAELTEFPSQVNQMEKLVLLGINNTKIKEVTSPLTNLKLIELDLYNNEITTFGDNVLSLDMNIRSIDLSGNDLSSLPASFSKLTSLRALNLKNNKFAVIPSQLETLTGLMSLSIGGDSFTSISTADIAFYPKLSELDLRGSKNLVIGDLVHENMDGLYISNCNLTKLPSLAGLPMMRQFEAAGNAFTSISALDFSANPALRKIDLSNNAELISLPTTTWGLSPIVTSLPNNATGGFAHLNVRDCPKLNWTPHADWKAFESVVGDYDPKGDDKYPDYDVPDSDNYKNRVGVVKKGSAGVRF